MRRLVLLVCYTVAAQFVPLMDDEIYYWCWAQRLQLSYFDHPPMVAYLIALSEAVFGQSVFALRLPACLAMTAVVGVVMELTTPKRILPWVLLTPLFTFGAVLMTPDVPLLLFWTLYLRWLVAVHRRLGGGESVPGWLWLVGGVLLGAGALGKYTMALAVPSGFLTFRLAALPWRRWLGGYLAHGVVALLTFLPVVVYNAERDFEPIHFQWAHAMTPVPSGRLGAVLAAEFALVQVVLFGTWPLVLFPWALVRARQLSESPRLRVCLAMYAVPMGFFLVKSFRGPLEGNWALVSYVGFWPLAAAWLERDCPARHGGRLLRAGFAVPAVVTLGLAWHLVSPVPWYPAKIDRIGRQQARLELAGAVARAVEDHGGGPVYTPTYQWVALLRYHGVDARQMPGVSRPSHFTTLPTGYDEAGSVLIWNETYLPPGLAEDFADPQTLASFGLAVRGVGHSDYLLMRYDRLGRLGRSGEESRR